MCPASLAMTALGVAGAAAAGGLAVLVMKGIQEWIDAQIAVERRLPAPFAADSHGSNARPSA